MTRTKSLRYIVTGPGIDEEPSYADPGPALSRTITAATRWHSEGTWYARDSISGDTVGFTERDQDGIITTTRRKA